MTPEVGQALLAAVDTLDGLGIRYAIVGGLAVGAWGVNRSTRDADLYAELPEAERPALQRAMERRGFHVPAMDEELVWFIAPEDLAVLKAFSERPRDFEDLVNLSAVVGARMDVAYIRRWAKQLDESIGSNDVSERLEKALAQNKPKTPQRKRKRSRER